jgi:hypothetical protein
MNKHLGLNYFFSLRNIWLAALFGLLVFNISCQKKTKEVKFVSESDMTEYVNVQQYFAGNFTTKSLVYDPATNNLFVHVVPSDEVGLFILRINLTDNSVDTVYEHQNISQWIFNSFTTIHMRIFNNRLYVMGGFNHLILVLSNLGGKLQLEQTLDYSSSNITTRDMVMDNQQNLKIIDYQNLYTYDPSGITRLDSVQLMPLQSTLSMGYLPITNLLCLSFTNDSIIRQYAPNGMLVNTVIVPKMNSWNELIVTQESNPKIFVSMNTMIARYNHDLSQLKEYEVPSLVPTQQFAVKVDIDYYTLFFLKDRKVYKIRLSKD